MYGDSNIIVVQQIRTQRLNTVVSLDQGNEKSDVFRLNFKKGQQYGF